MPQTVLYGIVGTPVKSDMTPSGIPATSFRLATTHRFFNAKDSEWTSAGTTWTTVLAYRQLSQNVVSSVRKGDRVIVTGRLTVRDWQAGEKTGREVEIIAESVGPDLRFMTSRSTRNDLASRSIPDPAPEGVDPDTGEITDSVPDAFGTDEQETSNGGEANQERNDADQPF
jgi:single-strand DNA-binding protein